MRFALRSLLQSPAYTIIALATLALGIGVNTSMFSVVDTLLFKSAPYPDADNLVILSASSTGGENRAFSEQEIREIKPAATGFETLTTLGFTFYALAEPGRPAERVRGITFSADMMETLRTPPMMGRAFLPEEYTPGKNQVVLLTESFWRSRFSGDPGAIGRTLRLDGETVTIVGVMPARFDYKMFWGTIGVIRPLNFTPDQIQYRGYRAFSLIGRLKPGTTVEMIAAQLAPVAADQQKAFPQDYAGRQYRAIPFHEAAIDSVGRSISWMLLGLAGFVLLICCANLANLQLARATASAREFAIRAALGASRTRLVFQQLAECLLLSVTGGGLGIVVALWVNSLLERSIRIDGAASLEIPIDAPVLAITLVLALLTGVIFGVVPALIASRSDVNTTLKSQSRGSTTGKGHNLVRHSLIVAEVALALVLLGGAAVMNRGFARMLERETGWDTEHILTGSLPLPEARYDTGEKRITFYRELEAKLAAIPGVENVAVTNGLPLFGYSSTAPIFTDTPGASAAGNNPVAAGALITPTYLATLGIPLREGRNFPPETDAASPQQVLVNEALAQRFWPGESAIGKRLGSTENNQVVWREVIGVVGNVEMAANISNPPTAFQFYRPMVQEPWSFVNVAVRSAHPGTLAEPVRRAVAELNPDLALDQVGTIREFVARTQHNLVVVGYTLTGFALLGLVLAAVGLYGVISHLVAQRTGEFGIKLALGALPRDLLTEVLLRGVRLSAIGLALGFAGAWGLGRFLASFMPRLAAPDPVAIAGVAVVLFAVTLVACWFPARRATKVDPLTALRAE
jgi:putative ABC transport system permease protein